MNSDHADRTGADKVPMPGGTDRNSATGAAASAHDGGHRSRSKERTPAEQPAARLRLDGVVYTSVFNPSDGRKNWTDMVTAFCHAFRDIKDATLVLKVIRREDDYFPSVLLSYLYRLSPFECRVVALDSFLHDEDYLRLIDATTFYVNTSHGEGQCLPLMEFMSRGKPAIAPRNSAFDDYIDEAVAFVLGSTREPIHWQHDPRTLFRAFQDRIDWLSVLRAYTESYRVAKEDPGQYRKMAQSCIVRMKEHCAQGVVLTKLQAFLESTPAHSRGAPDPRTFEAKAKQCWNATDE